MKFGEAIAEMQQGKRAYRKGWNGKNMFIYIEKEEYYECAPVHLQKWLRTEKAFLVPSHFNMWTAQETLVVGWLASQTDMLADDWEILP